MILRGVSSASLDWAYLNHIEILRRHDGFCFIRRAKMLRASAAEFLGKECPKSKVRELEEDDRGYDPGLWHKMAEDMG